MRTIAIVALLSGLAHAACITVPSNQILAGDLSKAVPLFQALDANDVIGYAPFPGMVRVLTSRDILLAARHYGLAFPAGQAAPSVCVERTVHYLSIGDLRAAMLSALDLPNVKLEILEFINRRIPPGRLEFSRASLNHPAGNNPETPVIWQGRLIYDGNHNLSVWARVRISVKREIVVAEETIPKGTVISSEQVGIAHVLQFPEFETTLMPSAVAGKMTTRTILAGQAIVPEVLEMPEDVMRGETVHVQAIDGAASIRLDGVAQSSGRKGEVIVVHNPLSGRNFRAVVEGREQAIVRGDL